ncbi:Mov34/MPN/PAD-1 family protein [Paenibacillus sanguinis]|uniref:Mov34/MPN/PAD-1 family protein n=1 Tax=Paenibacillus sanguinis TaxID=225906 RepID=UPI00037F4EAD|nr:Mov34/MPN/PAD-1 family protein [Paenibacillus sanguinis]
MNNKIYYHDDIKYTVVVNSEIIEQMLGFCRDKMPFETGGILIGKYSEDGYSAFINYITGPPKDSQHRTHEFFRGTHKLKALLSDLWKEGQYYLGEWHFHPNSLPSPSFIDRKQMREIAANSKYNCPEPILFILGGDPNAEWQTSCSIFPNKKFWIMLGEDG